jgi:hypothetical protein
MTDALSHDDIQQRLAELDNPVDGVEELYVTWSPRHHRFNLTKSGGLDVFDFTPWDGTYDDDVGWASCGALGAHLSVTVASDAPDVDPRPLLDAIVNDGVDDIDTDRVRDALAAAGASEDKGAYISPQLDSPAKGMSREHLVFKVKTEGLPAQVAVVVLRFDELITGPKETRKSGTFGGVLRGHQLLAFNGGSVSRLGEVLDRFAG